MLAAGLACSQAASAGPLPSIGDSRAPASSIAPASLARAIPEPVAEPPRRAVFGAEAASAEARAVADWIAASGDNRGLPFLIVDKANARVFLFDSVSRIRGAAPVLLGLGRGDDSIAGIGGRRLATMSESERTTPAGRFMASLGHDLEQDVLWVDYGSALSLHRVIIGNPKDRRHSRLASATVLDNRISYGCINVPASFYDGIVVPAFTGTVGIVYILPEIRSIAEVFGIPSPAVAAGSEPQPGVEDAGRGISG